MSKRNALIAIVAWLIGVLLIIPFNEWLNLKSTLNGLKFICIVIGLLVLIKAYQAFKKTAST